MINIVYLCAFTKNLISNTIFFGNFIFKNSFGKKIKVLKIILMKIIYDTKTRKIMKNSASNF